MRIGILSAELGAEDIAENARFVEEIDKAGHEPLIINYRHAATAVTESGRFLYQFDTDENPQAVEVNAVIPRINEADVLSITLGIVALETLISNGAYSTAAPSAIELAKNKVRSQIALDRAGIPTPYSIAPTGVEDTHPRGLLRLLESDPQKPVVIKTNVGTHGKGVVLGDSRRSARSILEGFSTHKIPVLLQEFVATPERLDAHQDIRLIVIEREVLTGMMREAKSEEDFRANLSLGGKATPYEATQREKEIAIKAAEVAGLDAAAIDILQSYRGPLLTEINISPGLGIEKVTGVNVAAALVKLAISKAEELPAIL